MLSNDISWKAQKLTEQSIAILEDEWHTLAHDAIEKNIYLFPWFARASLLLFEPKQLEIVLFYRGDVLIGLLIVQKDFGYAKLPIGFYRNALHPHQFLGTPLVKKGHAKAFAFGLCKWLDDSPTFRNFLLLTLLSADNEITSAINAMCKSQRRKVTELGRFERATIGSSQRNWQPETHISASRRKSLARRKKALSKLGVISVEKLAARDKIENWFQDFARLENMGWKREAGTSIEQNEADFLFYHQLLPMAAKDNAVNFLRLMVDNKPIAYTLDFMSPPNIYCHRCAYDISYKKYSPGIMLEYESMKIHCTGNAKPIIDSCTSADNQLLNELWPDRKNIISLAVARKTGIFPDFQFAMMKTIKKMSQERCATIVKES